MKRPMKSAVAAVMTALILLMSVPASLFATAMSADDWVVSSGEWSLSGSALTATGSGENNLWNKNTPLTDWFDITMNYTFAAQQSVETLRVALGSAMLMTMQYSNSQLLIQLQSFDGANWNTLFSKGWDAVNGPSGSLRFLRDAGSNSLHVVVKDTGNYQYQYDSPDIQSLLDSARSLGLITLNGSRVTFTNVSIETGVPSDWSGMSSAWSSGTTADGKYFVTGDTTDYSTIWNKSIRLADLWQFSTAVNFENANQSDRPDRINGRIFLGDANAGVYGILTAEYNPQIGKMYFSFEVQENGAWNTLYNSDWQTVSGRTVTFTFTHTETNTVRVQASDGAALSIDQTMTSTALQGLKRVGLVCDNAKITFGDMKILSLMPATTYSTLATQGYNDLIANFWNSSGYIYATTNGLKQTSSSEKGVPWERSTMVLAMDAYRRATGSSDAQSKLESDMNKFFTLYRDNILSSNSSAATSVGDGTRNTASDDAGWAAMMYMTYYNACIESSSLTTRNRAGYMRNWAKSTFDNAYNRWKVETDGQFQGLLYGDGSTRDYFTSLYAASIAIAGLDIYASDNSLTAYRDKAMQILDSLNTYHGRPDGLYWTDVKTDAGRTPIGYERPNDIREAGSVSFLGGNMAMAVLNARAYRLTGDQAYLSKALKTLDGLSALENNNGIYLNDRDGWTDGQFAYLFANEALTLPGADFRSAELLKATAVSIGANARESNGLYKAEWAGGNVWTNGGTTSSQIMTSANTVHMLMAGLEAAG